MTATRRTDHPTGSANPAAPGRDAFGAGAGRIWRRLAGAGVVALLALVFGVLATGEDGTDRDGGWWALVVVATTYVGAVLSWWISAAARGAVLARHAWAGAVLGLVLAAVLTACCSSGAGVLVVLGLIGVPAGALVAAAAAGAGLVVPARVAPVVALAGVLAAASLAWFTVRPAPPYDLVAVDATQEVAAAGGAEGLARRTAEAVQRAGRGGDPTSAPAWQDVGAEVSAGLGDARAHLRSTRVQDLPVSKATGQRTRLITVRVRGEGAWCVVLDPGAARVVEGACEDLDLVR